MDPISTYDLTEGVIVDIDPLLVLLNNTDVPLQSGVGADGNTMLSMDTVFEKKFEWQDEEILDAESTLATAGINASVTSFAVASGHGVRFQVGDAILMDNEQMLVTGISTDTLTVTREWAGTTGASHSQNVEIRILGANLPEGTTPPEARAQDWNNRYNITQIFGPTKVAVTGSEQAIRKYGLEGTTMFDHQLGLRYIEEQRKLEHALLYGTRYEANRRRQTGGMKYWITTNTDTMTSNTLNPSTNSAAVTEFLSMLQTIDDAGGNPDRCLVNGVNLVHIQMWNNSQIVTGRQDMGRGEVVWWFDSPFGRVSFVHHRQMALADVFLFSREQATIQTLRPWQFRMMGVQGDFDGGFILKECGLKFEAERWAGRFHSLSA